MSFLWRRTKNKNRRRDSTALVASSTPSQTVESLPVQRPSMSSAIDNSNYGSRPTGSGGEAGAAGTAFSIIRPSWPSSSLQSSSASGSSNTQTFRVGARSLSISAGPTPTPAPTPSPSPSLFSFLWSSSSSSWSSSSRTSLSASSSSSSSLCVICLEFRVVLSVHGHSDICSGCFSDFVCHLIRVPAPCFNKARCKQLIYFNDLLPHSEQMSAAAQRKVALLEAAVKDAVPRPTPSAEQLFKARRSLWKQGKTAHFAVCPSCLQIVERTDGCFHMTHHDYDGCNAKQCDFCFCCSMKLLQSSTHHEHENPRIDHYPFGYFKDCRAVRDGTAVEGFYEYQDDDEDEHHTNTKAKEAEIAELNKEYNTTKTRLKGLLANPPHAAALCSIGLVPLLCLFLFRFVFLLCSLLPLTAASCVATYFFLEHTQSYDFHSPLRLTSTTRSSSSFSAACSSSEHFSASAIRAAVQRRYLNALEFLLLGLTRLFLQSVLTVVNSAFGLLFLLSIQCILYGLRSLCVIFCPEVFPLFVALVRAKTKVLEKQNRVEEAYKIVRRTWKNRDRHTETQEWNENALSALFNVVVAMEQISMLFANQVDSERNKLKRKLHS